MSYYYPLKHKILFYFYYYLSKIFRSIGGSGIESHGNVAQNGFVFASIPSGIFPTESRTIQ